MNTSLRNALAVISFAFAGQAAAQVTFYEHENFQGQSFTTESQLDNFRNNGFNDRASSIVVTGERWEVCTDARFNGPCMVLRPGRYPSLAAMGLNDRVSSVRSVSRDTRVEERRYAPYPVAGYNNEAPNDMPGQVTFYEREGFQGQSFTTEQQIGNLERNGFNDRASSVVVHSGRWEICEGARFSGRCLIMLPGRYGSLAAMGMNNTVSSVRHVSRDARVEGNRYAPMPVAANDYRRGANERLYQANVTSSHAVMGTPEKRCWVESTQVPQERRTNVPGAVVGAVLGGILGHQIGNGRGQDIATVGGAVAGGAVGANVGGRGTTTQDVQRCENVANTKPEYWDVTYLFRGQEHRMQMTTEPGSTVVVNGLGEPRI